MKMVTTRAALTASDPIVCVRVLCQRTWYDSAEETLRDVLVDKQVEGFLARHEIDAQVKRIVASDVEAGERAARAG